MSDELTKEIEKLIEKEKYYKSEWYVISQKLKEKDKMIAILKEQLKDLKDGQKK